MAETAQKPTGWQAVTGFLDGLGSATNSVNGIVDSGANIAENIARGKGAIATQQLDKAEREQGLALQLAGFQRGDNRQMMWVIGLAAVALIILSK